MNRISVTQLNNYIKQLMDGDSLLSDVAVSGEISNFKRHTSGHMYFSLKEENSTLSAAMFKYQNRSLKFAPKDGMKVVAYGKVSVYPQSGQYQIIVSSLEPDGMGALYEAFEKLKLKLSREGLFSKERKKALPKFPKRVGVVTSKTGAAVRDIVSIIKRRYPIAEIVLVPVLVQGVDAPSEIAAAIRLLGEKNACDVMIVGRGGGSIEDLWGFNDEAVARAIADSRIPVISAVGHETDFTIADFAADVRAATPSAAAELAVPDSRELLAAVKTCKARMDNASSAMLSKRRTQLAALLSRPCLRNPMNVVELKYQRLDGITARIVSSYGALLLRRRERLSSVAAKLTALNPMSILSRGYSIAYKDETPLKSTRDVSIGDKIRVHLQHGDINCSVDSVLEER
ncbi:MAG: exodeoxyribonuclease VII large subunit [Oscillospiraceae bacterium]|jgi:exodeoxyribonuclease VII large subunit|nr:exodeoxyribonuclease VII large subunit [Oscillospiraceae bacterium]